MIDPLIQAARQAILAMLALSATLITFRLRDALELFQKTALFKRLEDEHVVAASVRRQRLSLKAERAIWVVIFLFLICLIEAAWQAMRVSTASASVTDPILMELFREKLLQLQNACFTYVGTVAVLVAFEYLLSSARRGRDEPVITPTSSHQVRIPKKWRAAVPALWQERIVFAASQCESRDPKQAEALRRAIQDGSWRSNWAVWAMCVAAYMRASRAAPVEH